MTHFIEVEIYVLENPNDEDFTEKELEVVFTIDDGRPRNEEFFVDGEQIKILDILEYNPRILKKIDHALDHYIYNYEGDF